MSHLPFRLGIFHSFSTFAWHAEEDRLNGGDWWDGDAFIDLAQRLEARAFDFLFFEDTLTVSRAIGGTMEADLKSYSYAPKHDVIPLLGALAKSTTDIGLFATVSTTFYPPWLLARSFSTIDSMSGGRAGWNIVTTGEQTSAENFGVELPDHDERYTMADEYLQVVKELWGAWDADALVQDLENNVHVDPTKVREIDHHGAYYNVRGPLNTLRSPQGSPILIQAGSSEKGRDFAAKHAEIVFAPMEGGIDGMIEFRNDIRSRAVAHGRDADDVKVLWAAFLTITDGDGTEVEVDFDRVQSFWSTSLDHDLSQHNPDEPFPADLPPTGHTGFFVELQELGKQGLSLREALLMMNARSGDGQVNLTGTPEQIAAQMIEANDRVGGDGYLIISANRSSRKHLDDVIDRLAPALQEAGVIQSSYAPGTTREKLAAPIQTPATESINAA